MDAIWRKIPHTQETWSEDTYTHTTYQMKGLCPLHSVCFLSGSEALINGGIGMDGGLTGGLTSAGSCGGQGVDTEASEELANSH